MFELIKRFFGCETEKRYMTPEVRPTKSDYADKHYIDESWRMYYRCPDCGAFERESTTVFIFRPHAMGGMIIPNGKKEFLERGCCLKCGTLRSEWELKPMRKINGVIEVKKD